MSEICEFRVIFEVKSGKYMDFLQKLRQIARRRRENFWVLSGILKNLKTPFQLSEKFENSQNPPSVFWIFIFQNLEPPPPVKIRGAGGDP